MRKYEKLLEDYPREYLEKQIMQWVKDEKARYCFVRNLLDGVSYEQIGAELNIVPGTVYNKIKKYSSVLFKNLK